MTSAYCAVQNDEETPTNRRAFELHARDSLFVCTAGAAEATDAYQPMYGTERMPEALNRDPEASPPEALSAVRRSVDEYAGSAPRFDDITMLCPRCKGGQKNQKRSERE